MPRFSTSHKLPAARTIFHLLLVTTTSIPALFGDGVFVVGVEHDSQQQVLQEQQDRRLLFSPGALPTDVPTSSDTLLSLPDAGSTAATMVFGFGFGRGGRASATESSLSSLSAQLEVENYPVAPDPLELAQVHVYVRHGERTPVGVRLANAPANIPHHWNMCKTANRFREAVVSERAGDVGRTRTVVERKDGVAVEGECLLGELTDLGRNSTFNFGKNLRKLYIERLGFLPDTLEKEDTVYFRTTNIPRTTESLQEIIRGLYPTGKCHPLAVPSIRIRNGKDENLYGNTYTCKRLEVLQVGFAKAAAEAYNPSLVHLDKKLSKYLDGNPIRVDGRPRASGILDTVRSAVAHGFKVPPEFEDKNVVDVIERAVVSEWFSDKTEEVRKLGMGRLLEDLITKMQHNVRNGGEDPLKILVHSTHDTAIAAICQTLDVFDEKWPAFTASVTFELFKAAEKDLGRKASSSSSSATTSTPRHYVRMRSQNQSVHLPICAEEGKHLPGHPEFCTLEAFRARMEELVPKDWEGECEVSSGGRR